MFRRAFIAVAFLLLPLPSGSSAAADLAKLVFVPNWSSAEVAVIDTRTDTVVERITVAAPPRQLAVSATLDLLVTSSPDENAISVVDLDGAAPPLRIPLDLTPEHIQLDPTGTLLAVSNYAGGSILLVDLAAKRVTARIDGFDGPHHLVFAREDQLLYVGNLGADRVSVVDVASAQIVQQIELGEVPDGAGTEPAAELGGVQSMTLSADGRRGFVTFGSGDGLAVVDLINQRLLKRLILGELSRRAYATKDGRHIVVPNDGDDTISIVDTATLGELARVPGALVMTGVSMGWFETTAFVFARTQRQAVVIDLEHGARVDTIQLPGRPETGVTTPDGTKLYVALGDRDGVAVIDTRAHRLMTVIDRVGGSPWNAQMIGTLNYCH